MEFLLMLVSMLLISVVLLQSAKASSSGILGGVESSELLKNRKERGGEKFMSQFTYFLGISFFVLCFIMAF